jgi:hypothetical protein
LANPTANNQSFLYTLNDGWAFLPWFFAMTIAAEDNPVENFVAQLATIPWFSNIGQPISDPSLPRLNHWDDWPGPEDPAIYDLHESQQRLYDSILTSAGENAAALTELWNRIHEIVFRYASHAVPYDPNEDTWHGPTMAVWQAAWTAGLIGLCLQSRHPIPPELEKQWLWFTRGHWPSGYASVSANGEPGALLVF